MICFTFWKGTEFFPSRVVNVINSVHRKSKSEILDQSFTDHPDPPAIASVRPEGSRRPQLADRIITAAQ